MLSRSEFEAAVAGVADVLERRIMLMALLGHEMEAMSLARPFVVGGHAVEFYTSGGRQTHDIDMKGSHDAVVDILSAWGFCKVEGPGTKFVHRDPGLDLAVHWLGDGPQAPFESRDRAVDIMVASMPVTFIGPEDLVIDRLAAVKFWKSSDDRIWAKAILQSAQAGGMGIDRDYLSRRAADEDVADLLDGLLMEDDDDAPGR